MFKYIHEHVVHYKFLKFLLCHLEQELTGIAVSILPIAIYAFCINSFLATLLYT